MPYLNQAGTSWPKPPPVQAAIAEALASRPETWPARLDADRAALASAFALADPSRLLLTPGCTAALSVGVANHAWRGGDRILLSGLEHHALHRPALELAKRGVEVVVAPRTATEPVALDFVEAELRRGGVRMVAMCAACNVTGEILPVQEIVSLAREYGATSLIDAAQVAGWLPVDLDRLGADLLAFAGHKGPQGPWGIGALYVAPHLRMPRDCDVGAIDRPALAGLAAGLRWLAEPARADRLSRARALAERLREGVAAIPGLTHHGPAAADARMPTVALTHATLAPAELAGGLSARGVVASGGHQCAPLAHQTLGTGPDGCLRLSLGLSNDEDDVAETLDALDAVCRASGGN